MTGIGWAAVAAIGVLGAGFGGWAWMSGWRVRLVWDAHGEPDDDIVEF